MSAFEDGKASVVMQATRLRIIKVLMEASGPCYIDQIAKELGENPRLISHHLDLLEDSGLVTSELRIVQKDGSQRGAAGRFFTPTPSLRKVFSEIAAVASKYGETRNAV